MNDLERLIEISETNENLLNVLVHKFLNVKDLKIQTLKTFIYTANDLLSKIPDNKCYQNLVCESLYKTLLQQALADVVAILDDKIHQREIDIQDSEFYHDFLQTLSSHFE